MVRSSVLPIKCSAQTHQGSWTHLNLEPCTRRIYRTPHRRQAVSIPESAARTLLCPLAQGKPVGDQQERGVMDNVCQHKQHKETIYSSTLLRSLMHPGKVSHPAAAHLDSVSLSFKEYRHYWSSRPLGCATVWAQGWREVLLPVAVCSIAESTVCLFPAKRWV